MKRFFAAAVVCAVAFVVAPAQAVSIPGGCAAVTAGNTTPSCSYVAAGPATFVAVSVSGFQIRVQRPDGTTRLTIGQSLSGCGAHVPAPSYGTIISEPGDTIVVSVGAACYYAGTVQPQPVGNPAPDPLVGPTQPVVITNPLDDSTIATVPAVSVPNPLPPSTPVPPQPLRLGAGAQLGYVMVTEGA